MKTKIQIKSILGSVLFEFEKENNTIKDTVEHAVKEKADLISADLSSADLRYADLRSADLSSADLSSADLRYADLSSADLRSADLSSANLICANLISADLRSADLSSADLCSANLRSAKTDKRYIQVSCIGSAKRMTTYCFEDDTIWCGCFRGTLDEFEAKVISIHSANDQYLKEYVGFINYLRSLK